MNDNNDNDDNMNDNNDNTNVYDNTISMLMSIFITGASADASAAASAEASAAACEAVCVSRGKILHTRNHSRESDCNEETSDSARRARGAARGRPLSTVRGTNSAPDTTKVKTLENATESPLGNSIENPLGE